MNFKLNLPVVFLCSVLIFVSFFISILYLLSVTTHGDSCVFTKSPYKREDKNFSQSCPGNFTVPLGCTSDAMSPQPWHRPQGKSCEVDFPGSQLPPLQVCTTKAPSQSEIPICITGNNNPTFVWYWIRLTECYKIPLRLYDQNSSFPPFLALLDEIEGGGEHYEHVTLVRNGQNRGPRFFFQEDIVAQLPHVFAVTDPDLIMMPLLPSNWLQVMAALSLDLLVPVGASLDISCPSKLWRTPYFQGQLIEEWESQFWKELYCPSQMAPHLQHLSQYAWKGWIDTTFAVYHKGGNGAAMAGAHAVPGVRLSGPFMAAHGPWYSDFLDLLLPGELQAQYIRGSLISSQGGQGSTVGKMLEASGLLKEGLFKPSDWKHGFSGRVWEWVASEGKV